MVVSAEDDVGAAGLDGGDEDVADLGVRGTIAAGPRGMV
jgi:hypothetical protein